MTGGKNKSGIYANHAAEEPFQAVLDLVREAEAQHLDEAAFKRLRWKLDLRLIPLLCVTYALQSIDKTILGYAPIFDLKTDLDLSGTEYPWLGAIFYLGYLALEFPTSMMLQKLPINYFMAGKVSQTLVPFHAWELKILSDHMGYHLHVPCECC